MSVNQYLPYLYKRVSLISTNNLRFEGQLFMINQQENTITLNHVKCFGTEERDTTNPIPASNDLYEFIVTNPTLILRLDLCQDQFMNPQMGMFNMPFPSPYMNGPQYFSYPMWGPNYYQMWGGYGQMPYGNSFGQNDETLKRFDFQGGYEDPLSNMMGDLNIKDNEGKKDIPTTTKDTPTKDQPKLDFKLPDYVFENKSEPNDKKSVKTENKEVPKKVDQKRTEDKPINQDTTKSDTKPTIKKEQITENSNTNHTNQKVNETVSKNDTKNEVKTENKIEMRYDNFKRGFNDQSNQGNRESYNQNRYKNDKNEQNGENNSFRYRNNYHSNQGNQRGYGNPRYNNRYPTNRRNDNRTDSRNNSNFTNTEFDVFESTRKFEKEKEMAEIEAEIQKQIQNGLIEDFDVPENAYNPSSLYDNLSCETLDKMKNKKNNKFERAKALKEQEQIDAETFGFNSNRNNYRNNNYNANRNNRPYNNRNNNYRNNNGVYRNNQDNYYNGNYRNNNQDNFRNNNQENFRNNNQDNFRNNNQDNFYNGKNQQHQKKGYRVKNSSGNVEN